MGKTPITGMAGEASHAGALVSSSGLSFEMGWVVGG